MSRASPTILITGASRGIGAAIAELAESRGWHVIGTCTKYRPGLPPAVAEWIECDFDQEGGVEPLLETLSGLDQLDALVNNAGINRIRPQEDVLPADYDSMEWVNLRSPYFIARAGAAKMARQPRGGRIVNIASIWSVISKPERTLYSTMKSALVGLTRSMAVEWGRRGVLVNAVSPGFVLTDLTRQSLTEDERTSLASEVPLGRLAEGNEIAQLVLFLCSCENTYLTGQNLVVDGGFTIV